MSAMQDLATLPGGSTIFVDTIIFDLHYRGKSAECDRFLKRIAAGEVTAYVNTQVLSDLIHKLMLADAYNQGMITSRGAEKLRQAFNGDKTLAAKLVHSHEHFKNTLGMGLQIRLVSKGVLLESRIHRQNEALLTGDSLHLETMRRLGVLDIATEDNDFSKVTGINVWSPYDVIP